MAPKHRRNLKKPLAAPQNAMMVLQLLPPPPTSENPPSLTTTTIPQKRQRTKFTDYQRLHMRQFAMSIGWHTGRHDRAAIQDLSNALGLAPNVITRWIQRNRKPDQQYPGRYVEKVGKPLRAIMPPPPAEQPSSSQAIIVRRRQRRMGIKRPRFTEDQKEKMREFAENRSWKTDPSDHDSIQELSAKIGLSSSQIKSWVRNHRQRIPLTNEWEAKSQ